MRWTWRRPAQAKSASCAARRAASAARSTSSSGVAAAVRRPSGAVGVQPVAAGPLGHAHHGVGEQQPVLGVEAGVDQRIDGLGDGLLDPAEGGPELDVVRRVPAVEEAEGVLVVDHELEVPGEPELDLLAGALGRRGRLHDAVDHGVGEDVEQLEVEGALGLEVLVHERLGDAGGLGDVVHGRGRVAVLGEEGERHVEELAAPGVGGQPAGRSGGGGRLPIRVAPWRRSSAWRSWYPRAGFRSGRDGPDQGRSYRSSSASGSSQARSCPPSRAASTAR